MIHRLCSIAAFASLAGAFAAARPMPQAPASIVVEYRMAGGLPARISSRAPCTVTAGRFIEAVDRADSVVDLAGGYVLPPFGEAHNHNIEVIPSQPGRLDGLIRRYMQNGVFYVQNPDNLPRTRDALAARLNRPEAPDVAFANGGITGPGGHPVAIAQRNVANGLWTVADVEGGFLFSVASATALEADGQSCWEPNRIWSRSTFCTARNTRRVLLIGRRLAGADSTQALCRKSSDVRIRLAFAWPRMSSRPLTFTSRLRPASIESLTCQGSAATRMGPYWIRRAIRSLTPTPRRQPQPTS